jgi:hypothetical protein
MCAPSRHDGSSHSWTASKSAACRSARPIALQRYAPQPVPVPVARAAARAAGCPARSWPPLTEPHASILPQAIFWVGIFLPCHWLIWHHVLPFAGTPALSLVFATSALLHAALFSAVSLSDPGVLTITPKESERLLEEEGVKGARCPRTGVLLVCRSRYVPYINEVVGRFDHYCDWVHNAIGAKNHRGACAAHLYSHLRWDYPYLHHHRCVLVAPPQCTWRSWSCRQPRSGWAPRSL